MSSFAAAIGVDAPVEVVNLAELEGLARVGVKWCGGRQWVGWVGGRWVGVDAPVEVVHQAPCLRALSRVGRCEPV